jgi:hypothetical protein
VAQGGQRLFQRVQAAGLDDQHAVQGAEGQLLELGLLDGARQLLLLLLCGDARGAGEGYLLKARDAQLALGVCVVKGNGLGKSTSKGAAVHVPNIADLALEPTPHSPAGPTGPPPHLCT